MDVRYITFDGVQSYEDMKLYIKEAEIGYPDKLKERIRIPNSNIFYDYADIFGDIYEERILEYTFILARETKQYSSQELEYWKSQIMNWLEPRTKHKLEDSVIPYYYFIGEVLSNPEWQQDSQFGYAFLKVKINCYPYKISINDMADDIWDSFEFENDVAQELEFEVDRETIKRVYNSSLTPITPKLVVNGSITVENHDEKVNLTSGTYEETEIMLNIGFNEVKLSGNGKIKFSFHKEVL